MGQKQQAPIPFANAMKGGLEELGGASPAAFNVIVRGGVLQRRPGLAAYSGAPSTAIDDGPIGAMLVTQDGVLYVVSGTSPRRKIYLVNASAAASLSPDGSSDVRGTSRPYMVETESILAIAGGDRPQKVVLSTNQSSELSDAPQGKRVIFHGSRLLIEDQDTKTLLDYSGVSSGPTDYSGFETWGTGIGTAGFISVNAKPDHVVAYGENSNEVFVWTTRGLQVFAPDATSDYVPSVTQEYGCSAPDSVIRMDQDFAWLDQHRRIIVSNGRSVVHLSQGIQKLLNDMTTVADCYGYRYIEGDTDVAVWSFPTDGRSFVYQKDAGWGEWSAWDATDNNWSAMTVTAHVAANGTNLVGTSDGLIRELSLRNSDASHASVTTGFQNRNTENRKTCNSVRLTLRRGRTTTSGEPVALLSWRDDFGPWGTPIEVGLGESGDTEPVVSFHGLGVYRRRQWRFVFTGTEDLQLVAAEETFTVQGN